MLTRYGIPFLIWLDEEVIPEAYRTLDAVATYVERWRAVLGV